MGTLFLHIGPHKTGSSAIQRSFYRSRTALNTVNVRYADLGRNHSHRMYSAFCQNPQDYPINIRHGIVSPDGIAAFNEETLLSLQRELVALRENDVIISAEDMSRLKEVEIQRLAHYLGPALDRTRVVAYVRNPVSLLLSLTQEEIKHGKRLPVVKADCPSLRYQASIQPFLTVFGKDRLIIREYAEKGIVKDFAKATVGAVAAEFLEEERANKSMCDPGVRIHNQYNNLFPSLICAKGEYVANPERPTELRPFMFLKDMSGPRFSLADNLLREVIESNRPDIQWMERVLGKELPKNAPSMNENIADDSDELYSFLARQLNRLMKSLESRQSRFARDAAAQMIKACPPGWSFGPSIHSISAQGTILAGRSPFMFLANFLRLRGWQSKNRQSKRPSRAAW